MRRVLHCTALVRDYDAHRRAHSQSLLSAFIEASREALLGWGGVKFSLIKPFGAVVVTLALSFSAVGVASAASTAPAPAATSLGYDISYPQCGHALPSSPGFGVIGVNGGMTFTSNKCLSSELAWAKTAVNSTPAFYANTGNPGPAFTSNWPQSQQTPDVCSGANTVPCSYDYGWNAARESFANAVAAESADGSPFPSATAVASPWWLDVETGNAWEVKAGYYGPTTSAYANDTAMIEGEIASLENIGITNVGVYSTSQQWRAITDASTANFPSVPVWIPGFGSVPTAETGCFSASFTSGRVAMTQYGANGYDADYLCGLLSAPTTVASTVAGSATFTDQVIVSNNNGAVTFTQNTGSPELVVSATGVVTTTGTLSAGTYVAAGTTSDTGGNVGTFSVTLDVGELSQAAPTSASVKASGSAAFTSQLSAPDAGLPVTFVQTSGTPDLVVSSSGLVTTSGVLVAGTYTATGTTSDTSGDTGVFTFSLKVGVLVQRVPTSGSVTTTNSPTFSQQLNVGANLGAVTFVQTSGTPNVLVSSSGLLTTDGVLATGSYHVTGTTSDPTGDIGTFTFTLRVTQATTTTTTPPVTTTTTKPGPIATSVSGHVVAGRTVQIAIHGEHFFGRPFVASHAGTTARVTRDTGTVLIVRVTSKARSRNGIFTFTIVFSNGTSCQVRYDQR